ncbi:MAG: hypothetical protein ACOY4K_13660 [Pseudomonadota bacterium]
MVLRGLGPCLIARLLRAERGDDRAGNDGVERPAAGARDGTPAERRPANPVR